jgi:hypothetical protein
MGSLSTSEDGLVVDGIAADALADYEHPVSVDKVRDAAATRMPASSSSSIAWQ